MFKFFGNTHGFPPLLPSLVRPTPPSSRRLTSCSAVRYCLLVFTSTKFLLPSEGTDHVHLAIHGLAWRPAPRCTQRMAERVFYWRQRIRSPRNTRGTSSRLSCRKEGAVPSAPGPAAGSEAPSSPGSWPLALGGEGTVISSAVDKWRIFKN